MKRLLAMLVLGGLFAPCAISGGSARAGFDISAASDAYALSTNLTLTLSVGPTNVLAVINPVADASGTATPAYSNTMHLASFSATAGAYGLPIAPSSVVSASTGIIDSLASSTVDGTVGSKSALGMETIHNLNLSTITSLTGGLLGLTADTIISTSSVTGTYGSLTPTGSTTLTNAHFSVLGIALGNLSAAPAPNTAVSLGVGIANVSVVLNEQTITGNGFNFSSIDTNAIHIRFNGTVVAGLGSLTGDIIIGHSSAQIRAVPEPASIALVTLGLGGAGLMLRSRRRAKARA